MRASAREREAVRERGGEWERVGRETACERGGEWERVERETVREMVSWSGLQCSRVRVNGSGWSECQCVRGRVAAG